MGLSLRMGFVEICVVKSRCGIDAKGKFNGSVQAWCFGCVCIGYGFGMEMVWYGYLGMALYFMRL